MNWLGHLKALLVPPRVGINLQDALTQRRIGVDIANNVRMAPFTKWWKAA